MTDIITLTDTARDHIQKFLQNLGDQAGFRVGIKKTGCSGYAYVVDVVKEPQAADIITAANAVPIFLDPNCIEIIQGTVIDFAEKGTGQKQLVFNNPNAQGTCGCGESFTTKESAI